MSQFISRSPQDDDKLACFMEHRSQSQSQSGQQSSPSCSAGSSQSTPQRNDTQSPRQLQSHSHTHSHGHNHSHGCNSPNHNHSHTPQQQQSQARGWSMASGSSSLGVPGSGTASASGSASGHDRPLSRSMSRTPSHEYRETLNAKSKDLEDGSRIINQYRITDIIGRGAYGTVRKAILNQDPSVQFAVKEFGKTRLRKTHGAVNFRKPPRGRGPQRRSEFNRDDKGNRSEPMRAGSNPNKEEQDEMKDPLTHIRHEIAILKKLHHPNVVKLYEVLDDPSKDSLYMVFEFCPDGTVIDIKLNKSVEPLPEDVARLYFVQVLMGIEYLHENEVVHRDIKPDNILLSDDRKTCKIVDFGVSEMFLKPGDDTMQKSAGSPAFMSPELCTAGHAEYHGKSDDIWSFGVTLYCMVVGHLPFNKDNFYELYQSIKNDDPDYPSHLSADLKDLLQKMLAKDPQKRITVPQMREHPWTKAVQDGILLSKEENIEKVVSEITDEDLDCAICKITNIFTFARAISRFKKGASVYRAREATRSTSGASEVDKDDNSWFPKQDKPSRANTQESKDVETIKEETPTPASKSEKEGGEKKQDNKEKVREKGGDEQVEELQRAAAYMFESPQMHTFELPPEEPNGNGPLQRNRSGPISTLHKPEPGEEENGPPIITMESPRSESPIMLASPSSEGGDPFDSHETSQDQRSSGNGTATVVTSSNRTESSTSGTAPSTTDCAQDSSQPDQEIATHLSDMMIDHKKQTPSGQKYESPARREEVFQHKHEKSDDKKEEGKEGNKPQRAKTVQEHAAALGKKKTKPKPKLLPDQPTFASPATETIKTPPDAAEVYRQAGHEDQEGDEGEGEDENPYFSSAVGKKEKDGKNKEEDESERQAVTV